jgi:hypothetical protein
MSGRRFVTGFTVVGVMILHIIQPTIRGVAGAALLCTVILRALVAGSTVRIDVMVDDCPLPCFSGMAQVAGARIMIIRLIM